MSVKSPIAILVTRPLPDADPLANYLRNLGYIALVEPMLNIQFCEKSYDKLDSAFLKKIAAVLVTSANGIRALVHTTKRRDMPLVVIGKATQEVALQHGFQKVSCAAVGEHANVELLAQYVRQHFLQDAGYFIHISGSEVAGNLDLMLAREGYLVERVVLYEAQPISALSPAIERAFHEAKIDVVLFYSARTTDVFLDKMHKARLQDALPFITAVCLSPSIVSAASKASWNQIYCADFPTTDHVLKILEHINR